MPQNEENKQSDSANISPGIPPGGMVTVDKGQLDELVEQNADLNTANGELLADLHTLVSAFTGLEGLFNGKKMNLGSITGVAMKLMSNPAELKKLEGIVPIIKKYSENKPNEQNKIN